MRASRFRVLGAGAIVIAGVIAVASATAVNDPDTRGGLTGYQEVPAIATPAKGAFEARMTKAGPIRYELRYKNIPDVSQAHLHFGQRAVNGGISVFLCTNLGNGLPPGFDTACPAGSAKLTGRIDADRVVGPSSQGIEAGDLGKLRRAIRNGVVYANVHSETYPGGEIRAQLRTR